MEQIKNLLADDGIEPSSVADATLQTLRRRLIDLKSDPGLSESFWVLTQLAWGARRDDFYDTLIRAGVPLPDPPKVESGTHLIALVAQHLERVIARDSTATVFSNIAQLSLRETLTRYLSHHARGLFSSSEEDVQKACRQLATTKRFGEVATDLFATFLSRLLRFYLDRETPNQIGAKGRFSSPLEADSFNDSIERYVHAFCRERAEILDEFSGAWASLHNYQGDLIRTEVQHRFLSHALDKLSEEVRRSAERNLP